MSLLSEGNSELRNTVESAYSGHGYSGHPLIVVNFESPEFFLQFSSKNRPLTVVKNPLIMVNFKNFHFKSDDFWAKKTNFIFFGQAKSVILTYKQCFSYYLTADLLFRACQHDLVIKFPEF